MLHYRVIGDIAGAVDQVSPYLRGAQTTWSRRRFVGWLALAVGALLAACGAPTDPQVEVTGPTMGTYYAVKVARPPAGLDAQTLQAGVELVLKGVIDAISTYDPQSELSRLNRNPSTDWVPISSELYAVLAEGQRLSRLSDGAFDITVGPLINLWGFGPQPKADAVPSAEAIAAARERVGYDKLELRADPPAIRRQRGDIYIDVSALGEGEGADRMAAYLESLGATDYMAAVAGTMRVRGNNAKRLAWGIAIEVPDPSDRAVQRILPLTDSAVSTSGDYRNFFKAAGKRYSHHIDPRTGNPVEQRLASVSVVAPGGGDSARRADGLATALIVMGEERGLALAESQGLAAYFIVREDRGLREVTSTAFARIAADLVH
ncbi:FAD:protein FMN transferase [Candidatus Thiodictyon syntrophicum]|jgi:thiamine biosynthesis lipoprotein|uniref:FAD:protein FMN transferase n=1 Tax=Candidatus Thiodictyon syntrophicum TaxID=1166950 RepID=A0A2K8UG50_9GAMM|nr:FAD:protein FMN transferase [Candidatus Thiodictyon syntrophicum]AUB84459.1 FAD:protein FMN transferase ApbE [Candidatus Thiodictyon syntrophicum]